MHAGCHEFECRKLNDVYSLSISLENEKITCPQEGGMIKVQGNYIGEIECPKPQ